MHRLLVCHLLRHWQQPAGLSDLISLGFTGLQRWPLDCVRADPWRCIFASLNRATRTIVHHPSHEGRSPPGLDPLIDSLRQSISQLPRLHRRAVTDAIAGIELQLDRNDSGYGLRLAALTQARALIRCERARAADLSGSAEYGDLWMAARSAAFWTLNFQSLNALEAAEFADWVRSKPLHLQELTLACIDDLLLCVLAQRMRRHERS